MKLILKPPLKELKLTQGFGFNGLCYHPQTKEVKGKPLKGCSVQGAGFISLYDEYCGMKGHNGLDYATKMGEPVYASHEGEITHIEREKDRGYGVEIMSEYKYELEGGNYRIKTRYWHLLGWAVKEGDKVKAGDLIGVADTTGIASGCHLHFECKPILADGTNAFQNNGFYGAINPEPFLEKPQENTILTKNLFYGMTDREVVWLKRGLAKLGYTDPTLNYTDYYGDKTAKLIERFQRENGVCWICVYKGKRFTTNSRIKYHELLLKVGVK